MKKLISLLLGVMLICSMSVSASALTTGLDLTVTKNGSNQDNYSWKTEKDGGGQYKNVAYATSTGFSGSGVIKMYSRQDDNTSIKSGTMNFSSSGVALSSAYNKYAKSGTTYRIYSWYGSGSSNSLRLIGRYTP